MRFYEVCTCADGFSISVQASKHHYCQPKVDGAMSYQAVEVSSPSEPVPDLLKWAKNPGRPKETIYAWVPVRLVRKVIQSHGGMVSGELPPGV